MNKVSILAATSCIFLLGACGASTSDRALSGAGLGAGVGAVGSAVAGGSVGTGALIGAGVGAAAGALTNQNQVDLGRPAWRR